VSHFHHKAIKRFHLDGQIFDESAIPRLKIEYIRLVVSQMRTLGYVPKFDIEPDFTIQFNEKKEIFTFNLSVYGVHVGKRKSEWILGIDGQKPIYMEKSKLNESLLAQALQLKVK
jgi:hypothetical protein